MPERLKTRVATDHELGCIVIQAVSEVQLLDALLLWAGRTDTSPAASDPRPLYIVEALMHLIRFPLMTEAELQVGAQVPLHFTLV